MLMKFGLMSRVDLHVARLILVLQGLFQQKLDAVRIIPAIGFLLPTQVILVLEYTRTCTLCSRWAYHLRQALCCWQARHLYVGSHRSMSPQWLQFLGLVEDSNRCRHA